MPRQEAIRDRVNSILPLYQLSRYRPPRPPTPRSGRANASSTTVGRAGRQQAGREASGAPITDPVRAPADPAATRDQIGEQHSGDEPGSRSMADLPDVAWISARDGSRAPGDLEDQAARYHPGRHELTINADFRAINDLIKHWHNRYRGIPGAKTVVEAQVREWCEQTLVEVVLAARNSTWSDEQLHALLSPTAFTAALLPRHLLHATLQKRLGQKLGATRRDSGVSAPHVTVTTQRDAGSRRPGDTEGVEWQLGERAR